MKIPVLPFLLFAGVAVAQQPADSIGSISQLSGFIQAGSDNAPRDLSGQSSVRQGDKLNTGKGSELSFSLDDGSDYRLFENSSLEIKEFDNQPGSQTLKMDMPSGHVVTEMGGIGDSADESFSIATPIGDLHAVAADFELFVFNMPGKSPEVFIRVLNGAVRFINRSGDFPLPRGELLKFSGSNSGPRQVDQSSPDDSGIPPGLMRAGDGSAPARQTPQPTPPATARPTARPTTVPTPPPSTPPTATPTPGPSNRPTPRPSATPTPQPTATPTPTPSASPTPQPTPTPDPSPTPEPPNSPF